MPRQPYSVTVLSTGGRLHSLPFWKGRGLGSGLRTPSSQRALKKVPVFGKTNKKAASYCTSEQFSDGQILNLFCLTQWLR